MEGTINWMDGVLSCTDSERPKVVRCRCLHLLLPSAGDHNINTKMCKHTNKKHQSWDIAGRKSEDRCTASGLTGVKVNILNDKTINVMK